MKRIRLSVEDTAKFFGIDMAGKRVCKDIDIIKHLGRDPIVCGWKDCSICPLKRDG
jgi:hypothetical protein